MRRDIWLIILLILFDICIHPLTLGPDRRIHDPAVYRLQDAHYLPGDWYTDMATQSKVYTFYAELISVSHSVGIPEEVWRLGLYIVSLVILYYALIKIADLFSRSWWVVPIIAGLHAVFITSMPPIWLYGPFMQIDGGFAPRSLGVALSFLALYYCLTKPRIAPWLVLGLATLIHVSNSLIVFTLLFLVWLGRELILKYPLNKNNFLAIIQQALMALSVYLLAGGWFALVLASHSGGLPADFPASKLIWTWIYFRAPYMALPLVPLRSWLWLTGHGVVMVAGWWYLRRHSDGSGRRNLDWLLTLALGALVYFGIFYVFAFVWPWLPGFQFYSLRVIYFFYFVTYLVAALGIRAGYLYIKEKLSQRNQFLLPLVTGIVVIGVFIYSVPGLQFVKRAPDNIQASWLELTDSAIKPPTEATARYLFEHPEPFLAPPNWYGSPAYLPSVANFKSFGFTAQGLPEWFNRLNDVSGGELERTYEKQMQTGQFAPVALDWPRLYAQLTPQDVATLAAKYHFHLFLTYRQLSYPWPIIADDGDWRLYWLP